MSKYNDKLIESVVKQVINEYGGVSDVIMDMSSIIFNEICNQHRMYSREVNRQLPPFEEHYVCEKIFQLDLSNMGQYKNIVDYVSVRLLFYDPQDESFKQLKDYMAENGLLKLCFQPRLKRIVLSFAWPTNDVMDSSAESYIMSSINHEVKHAYQYYKSNNSTVSLQYIKATMEQERPIGYYKEADTPLKQLADYYVPNVYYKLDKGEIDAWMQEMYIEAKHTNDIYSTNTYKHLLTTIKRYDELKQWYNSDWDYFKKQKEYIDTVINRIDTPSNYFKVCDTNMSYLKRKMRRVIGRWNEENGNARGTFKQYASNEIPQSNMFVNKPYNKKKQSAIRRILNNFLKKRKK